ncbi:MAG TPA: hypothetical protein VFR97_06655 [Capillimicrobium sp.]|nr:hypothetical protein [Capillimicrobium sp.]
MSTNTISLPSHSRVPAVLRAAQVLLLLLGAVTTFGAIYFCFFVPADVLDRPDSVSDWLVGAWALTIGLSALYLGARLTGPDTRIRRAARWLLAIHIVFGIVKLTVYSEQEALTFVAVDAVVLGLLSTRAARGYLLAK